MCIICFCPAGVDLPGYDLLENCQMANPHGMGLMYREQGKIHILKGYFDLDEFVDVIYGLGEKTKDLDIALHFRFRTAGKTRKSCCHPFPLDGTSFLALDTDCDRALMHNGHISRYVHKRADTSDTMYFAEELSRVDNVEDYKRHIKFDDGKFLIMTGRETLFFGEFVCQDGIFWSNRSFETSSSRNNYSSEIRLLKSDSAIKQVVA